MNRKQKKTYLKNNISKIQCKSGKKSYSDRKKAKWHAIKKSKEFGYNLRVYRCPDCRFYHLTKLKSYIRYD